MHDIVSDEELAATIKAALASRDAEPVIIDGGKPDTVFGDGDAGG